MIWSLENETEELREHALRKLLAAQVDAIDDAIAGLKINGIEDDQITLCRTVSGPNMTTIIFVDHVPKYEFSVNTSMSSASDGDHQAGG